jgi:hypothetical protein
VAGVRKTAINFPVLQPEVFAIVTVFRTGGIER